MTTKSKRLLTIDVNDFRKEYESNYSNEHKLMLLLDKVNELFNKATLSLDKLDIELLTKKIARRIEILKPVA
jgi:flagellin-specific chaperone FliS